MVAKNRGMIRSRNNDPTVTWERFPTAILLSTTWLATERHEP